MHRGVIDVLDGTYFVFFEEVLSGAIRTFDVIEVAGAVRTSGAVGISDVVGTSGTPGVVTTSGAVGASDAIRTSCGAVEGPVDAVITGGSTDAGAGGSVDSGFCATGEESDAFTEAEAMYGCSKAIVTAVLVGRGSGRIIEEIFGAATTAVMDSDIDSISRG
jgi:hypothetical protein